MERSEQELSQLIAVSVLRNTQGACTKEWLTWTRQLKDEENIRESYPR